MHIRLVDSYDGNSITEYDQNWLFPKADFCFKGDVCERTAMVVFRLSTKVFCGLVLICRMVMLLLFLLYFFSD